MTDELLKIKSFRDLFAWQVGHELVLMIYKVTQNFPAIEQFGLTSQMRRCAVSITSNIAEGFSRRTLKDKINFYTMSLGSVTELQNQLLISKDVNYLNKDVFLNIANRTVDVHKALNGAIKKLRKLDC